MHDETELNGRFDFSLEWTPDTEPSPEHEAADLNISSAGSSIFGAITEQLGLRLEAKKGPVHVYVVEKMERPTEN